MIKSKKIFRCYLLIILSVAILISVNISVYAQIYIYGDWSKDTLINSEDFVVLRRFLLSDEAEYTIRDLVRSKKRAVSFLNVEKFSSETENSAKNPLDVTANTDIPLDNLFKAVENVEIISSQVEVGFSTETGNVSIEKTLNTDNWEQGVVKFSGVGIGKLYIAENSLVTELYIEVKENISDAKIERTTNIKQYNTWYESGSLYIKKYGLCMPFMYGLTITDYREDKTEEIFTEEQMLNNISSISGEFDYSLGAFAFIIEFKDGRFLEVGIKGAPRLTDNATVSFTNETTVKLKKYDNAIYLCTDAYLTKKKTTVYWTIDYYKFTGNNGNTVTYDTDTEFLWSTHIDTGGNINLNSFEDLL